MKYVKEDATLCQ